MLLLELLIAAEPTVGLLTVKGLGNNRRSGASVNGNPMGGEKRQFFNSARGLRHFKLIVIAFRR
jgi:hypothetical protein